MLIDKFEKEAEDLKKKKLWLFDIDGTLLSSYNVFDGTKDLLNNIENNDSKFCFITNNSTKNTIDYYQKFEKLALPYHKDSFYTSLNVTIKLLKEKFSKQNDLIYVQGTKSFINELKKASLNVTIEDVPGITCILIGFDDEYDFKTIIKTCKVVTTHDVPYYGTNMDLACPVDFGFIPDCGSMAEMIYNATGKKPIFLGKPNPQMIYDCMEHYQVTKEETVVVGDRLYTDILSGINAGCDTIAVLTGETTIDEISNSSYKPTYVFDSVRDIKIK